jgi:hypothetical protein
MATVTPNYNWDVPTSTDYVADGAVAIETLGDDIDATLFSITGGKNLGLAPLNTTNFTTQAAVQINNVFTTTYANYLIELNVAGSTPATLEMQTATSGTPQSGSVYEYGGNYTTFTAVTVVGVSSLTSKTSGTVGYLNTTQGALNIFVNGPQINNLTTWSSIGTGQGLSSTIQGRMGTAFQSDGIRFFPSAGTITGTIRIYGLRN